MHRRPRERRSEAGFTLVELLVVIVILGILSAVVVFAVRGAGDKGKGAAIATDERTLRTAQEAYCAKAGHYATMDQLTGDALANDNTNTYKFLSDPSEYHALSDSPPSGSCNGTGYEIICKDRTPMPNCGASVPEVLPVGSWDRAGDLLAPGYVGVLLATASGRTVLLGHGENGASSVYDAAARTWTPTVPIPELTGAVAIPGLPTPTCPNCGKVLVQRSSVSGPEWFLYDPVSQAFVPIPPNRHACRLGTALTPLADGTILAVGCAASGAPTDLGPADSKRTEIFDPRLSAGSPCTPVGDMNIDAGDPLAVRLKDDRVLAVGGEGSKRAEIYNPDSKTWTSVAPASNRYLPEQASITLLPGDGRVLLMTGVVGGPSQAELYNPIDNTWSQPVSCACPNGHSATLLASGRVLVAGGDAPAGSSQSATLFDPTDDSWVPAKSMPPPGRAKQGAVLLTGAACAARPSDCGKVLVAGGQTSVPPSPSTLLFSE